VNTIKKILQSDFIQELNKINSNYFNLKHELFIRNELLNKYNSICQKNEVAIAEYPKLKGAVDLSIIKDNHINNKIELKYQYPKDLNHKACIDALLKDVNDKKGTGFCTDFILIIHERSDEIKSFSIGGVKPIFIERNEAFSLHSTQLLLFEKRIIREFRKDIIPIETVKPYNSIYYFIFYHF
jgi:hypothetical protein